MRSPTRRLAATGLLLGAVIGWTRPTTAHAQAGVVAAGATTPAGPQMKWTEADAQFMTGMIAHHAQAVMMAGWAPSHGASPAVRGLCERIVVGQRDEIKLMQRWLREWGKPVPEADASHDMMPGMEHHLMPGMLTAQELQQLDQARGPDFDELFLKFMIRHHQGALQMVQQLIETPNAARDDWIFKFVSDINADQTTEIHRMTLMQAGIPVTAVGP
jgi:uncharacterized protein (DUF305 family)